MDYLPPRSKEGTLKLQQGHRKGRSRPANLREQVDPETMRMYPTPRSSGQENPETLIKRKGIKAAAQHNLTAAVKMYPTPQRSDHLHNQSETLEAWEKRAKQKKEEKGINLQFALRHAVQKEEREKKMYVTPTTQDARIGPNNIGGNKHRVKRGSIALADQILFPNNTKPKMYPTPTATERSGINPKTGKGAGLSKMVKMMYPTPTVGCEEGGEQSERVERTKSGGFILRKKNKPESTFGAKLSDAMLYLEKKKKLFYSPTTNDSKNLTLPKSQKDRHSVVGDMLQMKQNKPGGKLNPTFVEFLMGFPMDWTKTEPTESKPSVTQSSHKSQEK
jgi:hypothetical protein